MEILIEDYERRLKTVLEELRVCELNIEKEARLETKASCYRTFIAEMKREQLALPAVRQRSELVCFCGAKQDTFSENNRVHRVCKNGHEE